MLYIDVPMIIEATKTGTLSKMLLLELQANPIWCLRIYIVFDSWPSHSISNYASISLCVDIMLKVKLLGQ